MSRLVRLAIYNLMAKGAKNLFIHHIYIYTKETASIRSANEKKHNVPNKLSG